MVSKGRDHARHRTQEPHKRCDGGKDKDDSAESIKLRLLLQERLIEYICLLVSRLVARKMTAASTLA